VYLGGLFQHLDPLLVALTAFGLCSLGLLPLTLARDPGAAALLVRGALPLIWINVTTAAAWLSFFFALKTIEPALVQILFYGVGPLSVRWLDGLVPGSARATLGRTERSLHLGLLAALVGAAAVVLCGYSGLNRQPVAVAVRGVVLAVGGGVSIAISTLLCRGLNDAGMKPATLLSLRFPGAVLLAAAVALGQSRPLLVGVTPAVFAALAPACLLLIVLPNYVNQVGVALASPVTVRAVLALGPVLVFSLQLAEARLTSSPWTLGVAVLYALFAIASALARRRAIGTGPPGDVVTDAVAPEPRVESRLDRVLHVCGLRRSPAASTPRIA
jgi:drug/metabolite transporter (DMT)-like permease